MGEWLAAEWLVSTLWNNEIVDTGLFIHSGLLKNFFPITAFGRYVGANSLVLGWLLEGAHWVGFGRTGIVTAVIQQ